MRDLDDPLSRGTFRLVSLFVSWRWNLLEHLPTLRPVGIISNMQAESLLDERHVLGETAFAELVVWRVPKSVRGSAHRFRYRLALVVTGECVLRYDNEAGKGDHRHAGNTEATYRFTTPEQLLADFWADVDNWRL